MKKKAGNLLGIVYTKVPELFSEICKNNNLLVKISKIYTIGRVLQDSLLYRALGLNNHFIHFCFGVKLQSHPLNIHSHMDTTHSG